MTTKISIRRSTCHGCGHVMSVGNVTPEELQRLVDAHKAKCPGEKYAPTTVADLIKLLQVLPQDLPVYLNDWNEGYAHDLAMGPNEAPCVVEAETVRTRYYVKQLPKRVVIG